MLLIMWKKSKIIENSLDASPWNRLIRAYTKHVLFSDLIFDFRHIGPRVFHSSTAAVCLQSAFVSARARLI